MLTKAGSENETSIIHLCKKRMLSWAKGVLIPRDEIARVQKPPSTADMIAISITNSQLRRTAELRRAQNTNYLGIPRAEIQVINRDTDLTTIYKEMGDNVPGHSGEDFYLAQRVK